MTKQSFEYYVEAIENNEINKLQIFLLTDDEEFINIRDEDGNTLLHHAAMLSSDGAVAMLIECNPFIRNNEGKTAFNIAYENDDVYIAKMLDSTRDSCKGSMADMMRKKGNRWKRNTIFLNRH